MSNLSTAALVANEIAKVVDFSYANDQSINNITVALRSILTGENTDYVIGGKVLPYPSGGMNFIIEPIYGHCKASGIDVIDTDKTPQPTSLEAAHATMDRYDTVQIRGKEILSDYQQRKFKDPETGVLSTENIPTKKHIELEIMVKRGVDGSVTAPVVDNGWVKLAEIFIPAGTVRITNDHINNITARAYSQENSAWTIEKARTFNPGFLFDIISTYLLEHNKEGGHKEKVIKADNIKFGIEDSDVNSRIIPIGKSMTLKGENYASQISLTTIISAITMVINSLFPYIDDIFGRFKYTADSPVAASTGNVNITVGGEVTIDGIFCSQGQCVFLKDQTDSKENGLWEVKAEAWTRYTGYTKTTPKAFLNKFIGVKSGNTNNGKVFYLQNGENCSIGENNLVFSESSLTPSYIGLPANIVTTDKIKDKNVTLAKIQDLTTDATSNKAIFSTETITFLNLLKKIWGGINWLNKRDENSIGINELPTDAFAHWSCELPEIPDDPAGVKYKNLPSWSDCPVAATGIYSVTNNVIYLENTYLHKVLPVTQGDMVIVRARKLIGAFGDLKLNLVGMDSINFGVLTNSWTVYSAIVPAGATLTQELCVTDWHNSVYEISDLYIGNASYLTPLLDNSGNGRNLSFLNRVVSTQGKFGNGIQFYGGYAQVNIPQIFRNDFTISFWLKKSSDNNDGRSLLGNADNGISLFSYGSELSYFHFTNPATWEYIQFQLTKNIPLNKWTNIILKRKGSAIICKIDGVITFNENIPIPSNLSNINFYVNYGSIYPPSSSSLDEIALFTRATTDREDEALYQTALLKKTIGVNNVFPLLNTEKMSEHSDQVEGEGRDLRKVFKIYSTDPTVYIPEIMAEIRRRCNNSGEIDASQIPDFSGIAIGDYIDGLDLSGIAAPTGGNAPQAWNDTYKNNRLVVSGFNTFKNIGNTENTKNHIFFTFRNCVAKGRINPTNTNNNGYSGSEIRIWNEGANGDGNGVLANKLKEKLGGNYLYKIRRGNTDSGSAAVWKDYTVFLLTEAEVFGNQIFNKEMNTFNLNVHIPIFANGCEYIVKKWNGVRSSWWLHSSISSHNLNFCNVEGTGHADHNNASDILGIAPAFCVA